MDNALKALSMIDDETSEYGTILSVSGPGKFLFLFSFLFSLSFCFNIFLPSFSIVVIAEKMAGSAMFELVRDLLEGLTQFEMKKKKKKKIGFGFPIP